MITLLCKRPTAKWQEYEIIAASANQMKLQEMADKLKQHHPESSFFYKTVPTL